MKQLALALAAAAAIAAAPAFAGPSSPVGAVDVRQGVVEQVTETQISTSHRSGVGAVVGGLSGFGIGNLMGRGSGRDVARVLGAVGGAVAGNEVQKNYDRPVPAQHIIVRMESGVLVAVTQPSDMRIRVKLPVYVEGNGEAARVTPR